MVKKQRNKKVLTYRARLILCETDRSDILPHTEYPGPESPLPLDLETGADATLQGPNFQALHQITLSSLNAAGASRFGRQTQSVSLLDRLMSILGDTASNKESKLEKLATLETTVRNFDGVVMLELENCTPVALCSRYNHRAAGVRG